MDVKDIDFVNDPDFVAKLNRLEIDRYLALSPEERAKEDERTYAPLPEVGPDHPCKEEWDLFRQRVAQLIREGHENKYALVRGKDLTVWTGLRDACQAARLLYADTPCLIQEIIPYLRAVRTGVRR